MSIDFKPGSKPGEKQEKGGITWIWDGEKWNRDIPAGKSKGEVYIGDTAPLEPYEGQLWWHSDASELTMYIYYNDVWVPASNT